METKLPKNWINTRIKDIAVTQSGGTPSTGRADYWDGNIPWINSGKLKDVIITEPSRYITQLGLKESSARLFPKNTVVIALTGATTGKMGLLGIETATNQSVTGILPSSFIDPKFIFYQLIYLRSEILSQALGTAQPHINKGIVDETQIRLAPLIEQKKISSKLDEAFGKLETINLKLRRVSEILKTLRQTILRHAISGILTEKWRLDKKLDEWKYELAKDCCIKVQSGGTPKGSVFDIEGIPFLKVYNIVDQCINFDYKPQFVSEKMQNTQLKKSITFPGDVVMNIVGPPLGKVAIVPDDYDEWNINQAIALFRPNEYLLNTFLYYFFCEGTSVRSLVNETKGVVGQVNISLSQCRELKIPIPTIIEQEEIVNKVKRLFDKVNLIEGHYKLIKSKVDKIPLTLLNKAFNGDLVTQDENDEHASKLLERVLSLNQKLQ